MKADLVWICNRQKNPHTEEQINPNHIVRTAKVKLEEKECFVQCYKLEFVNGYSVIVNERDYKKVVQ